MYMNVCVFAGIYGGFLLGVRSVNGLAFYDWDNTELIRRIEIQPKHVSQLLQSFIISSAFYYCIWTNCTLHLFSDFLVRLW